MSNGKYYSVVQQMYIKYKMFQFTQFTEMFRVASPPSGMFIGNGKKNLKNLTALREHRPPTRTIINSSLIYTA